MRRRSKEPKGDIPVVVGETVTGKLADVTPNDWNPNRLTPFEKQALLYGLEKDGWLASHAMTIWRKDPEGTVLNVIIDGEHRWRAGKELGFTEAPMVFLDGLTEEQAKALTVKLDAKRGRFNEEKLTAVLRDIIGELEPESRSFNLGIEESDLTKYLSDEKGGVIGELPSGQAAHVKMVQIVLSAPMYDVFQKMVKTLSVRFKTKNVTDTVLEGVRRASAAAAAK